MSWFLLAAVAFLTSITFFIGIVMIWYLKTTERKKGRMVKEVTTEEKR